MEVKLVVVGGAEAQASEFSLKLPTVIGRSRTADLPLANPLVSRRHCEVFEAGGQLMVRDLGSLNGTFIGKTRVADEAPVPPGSVLTIGAIIFRADYVGPNGASQPAADAEKPAAAPLPASDESTVSVDELETLQPIGESTDDADFNLAWLEEGAADSGEANGASAGQAAVKETVSTKDPAKKTVPAKPPAPAAGAKGKAPEKAADESDSLDDLDDLMK